MYSPEAQNKHARHTVYSLVASGLQKENKGGHFQGCRSTKRVLWIFNCGAEIYLVIMETI